MGPTVAAAIPVITQIATAVSALKTVRDTFKKPKQPAAPPPVQAKQEEQFTPIRPKEVDRPESLAEYGGFTPQQERAALATQGVQQGLGAQEQEYYKNLLQRQLIGQGGEVSQQKDFLLPVESQFFTGRGVGTSNVMDFLKAIRG